MKKILITIFLAINTITLYSQNLYPEKFDDCKLTAFCLDCGDPKAQPPKTIIQNILTGIGEKNLGILKGTIELQILIHQDGRPCLLSVDNKTNISSVDLKLKASVNGTENWTPAITGTKKENSSVSIILQFEDGKYGAKRRIFDFTNQSNMAAKGSPDRMGSDKSQLSET